MDFITANMLMFCIILLWICSGLLLWQQIKLQRKVDQLEYDKLEHLERRIQDMEFFWNIWNRDILADHLCKNCKRRNDCPTYNSKLQYPCYKPDLNIF